MPFEIMDQSGVSASSHLFDDISFGSERNVGLPKPISIQGHYQQGKSGMVSSHSLFNASLPTEISARTGLPISQISLSAESTEKLHVGGDKAIINMSKPSKETLNPHPRSWSNVSMQPASTSYGLIGNKMVSDAASHESSLFSSSLSEIFTRKLRLMGNNIQSTQPITVGFPSEEEPFKTLEEIEADTIGNLLPDEDDLFAGVNDEVGHEAYARTNDDLEDFDLFSSGGGMELEGDEHLSSVKRIDSLDGDSGYFGGSKGKLPFGEQPSRTLFVRNINSNVEDPELKALFEQYGEIRSMYTACKHRGFVMISYYDQRAAQNAMKALQNRSLKSRKLDIHYSIPKGNAPEKDIGHGTLVLSGLDSSVSNDELQHIFGFYGEIREIYETPEMNQHKFIEFYDVRAAEAALRALNRSDIAGKQIKLEPGHPRAATCLLPQSQMGQDEPDLGQSLGGNLLLRQKATMSSGVNPSGCLDNGTNQGFQSTIRQPVNAFIDNAFSHVNSSIHNTGKEAPVGNVSGICKSSNFVDTMNFVSIPRFHAHSFPKHLDSLADGSPSNFSSTTSNGVSNIGMGVKEGSDSRHAQGLSSAGNLMEFNGGGNGSLAHHGLYHMWNRSNLHQQPPPGPMLWQKPPSFVNGARAPCPPQMPSFPGTPPHVLRASHIGHQVGSAPVVTASPWDRQQSYTGGSPDASGIHLGSLGSAGFPGNWQLHLPDFSSHMFSHVGGSGVELTSNTGQSSPKQMTHVFPGRAPMTSMSKFDSTNERMRPLNHRRSEVNINSDKKQYELNLGRILRGEDNRTTLMIKNIPNKYTSKMLLAAIDEQCRGTYDFLYLPIDFKNKCNVGYAFINMIDPGQIIPFHQAFNGKKWEKFNSEKVASLAYARIQGKPALIAHFQNSSLMNEDKRCRPILFHTDGPNAGDPEPFPMGTNIRLRPGKYRTCGNEENRSQVGPSTSAGGEESRDSSVRS